MAENTKDLLTFKKGLRENLPGLDQCKAGTIYVTTDERAMYVDISDTQRIRLGDFIEYATEDDFKKAGHYSETALYYIAEGHKLLKYSKTNDDNTIDFVYLNSTSTIATDLAELTKQVNTNKTDIATLKTDRVTVTDFNAFKEANTAAIAAAKKAGDDAQADVDALELVVNNSTTGLAATKAIADKNKTDLAALEVRVKANEDNKADKTDVSNEVERLEGLISDAQTQANKGVADAATAQAKANAAATQAETNKTNIASLTSTKADKTQVATDIATAKSEVQTYVDNQFKAADAMRYMGETDSLAHLKDGTKLKPGFNPAQAGDTYVLTSNDTAANAGIGDLFIAKVDGDNSQWTHIKSGYNASHENKLVGADNKIKLQSYAGIDLNSIEVEGLGSAEVTVANNKLTVSTVWGSF